MKKHAVGTATRDHFDSWALEQASLNELVESAAQKLVASGVLQRAANSGLYRARWQRAGFAPGGVKNLNDLRRAPFTSEHNLVQACHARRIKSYPCSEVRRWFRVAGKAGGMWWMPCGQRDIMTMLELCRRMSRVVGIDEGDVALVLSQPPPAASDSLPYFLGYAEKLERQGTLEVIPLSLMLLLHRPAWASFFLKRQPTVLVSAPQEALLLAEILKSKPVAWPSTSAAAGIPGGNAEPDRPLEQLRLALLFGSSTDHDRHRAAKEYGVETFQTQGATDCLLLNVECQAHDGVHVWLDTCIPEVLPATDLNAKRVGSRAIFLHEADPGTKGELVVTTFGEALPLIRYRTGERIEVISTGRCRCGLSHPRVRFV